MREIDRAVYGDEHAHSVTSVPGIFCLFFIVLRIVKGQEEREVKK